MRRFFLATILLLIFHSLFCNGNGVLVSIQTTGSREKIRAQMPFFRDFCFVYAKSMLNSFTHAAQSLYLCGLWEKHKIYVKSFIIFLFFPLFYSKSPLTVYCMRLPAVQDLQLQPDLCFQIHCARRSYSPE